MDFSNSYIMYIDNRKSSEMHNILIDQILSHKCLYHWYKTEYLADAPNNEDKNGRGHNFKLVF